MVKTSSFNYLTDFVSNYRKGLDFQRERFKEAKHQNDYDCMCDAVENLKSEIKIKVIKKKRGKIIKKIENITRWYRTLESRYIRNTPQGKKVVFPGNIHNQVNHKLTIAFELVIVELDLLDLL